MCVCVREKVCNGLICFWCACVCKTKRLVYKAVVLGIILYGSETWTTKRFHVRKLEVFHNRCMRTIMGISSVQQRLEHISTIQVAK